MRPLQRRERSVQNEKCRRGKSREDSPLQAQSFPEHAAVAERVEPEHVHVIRQSGPSGEENSEKYGENEKEAAATSRRIRPRPVNRLRHGPSPCTAFAWLGLYVSWRKGAGKITGIASEPVVHSQRYARRTTDLRFFGISFYWGGGPCWSAPAPGGPWRPFFI